MGSADILRMQDDWGISYCWNRTVFIPFDNSGSYVIFLITANGDDFMLDGEMKHFPAGTLGLLSPGTAFSLAKERVTKSEMVLISVSSGKLESVLSMLGISLEDLLKESGVMTKLCDEAVEQFIPLLTEVNYLMEKASPANVICGAVTDVLVHSLVTLSRALDEERNENEGWFESLMKKLSAPEYISSRADEIYELAGFSAPVVINAFRKYTGGGVSEYLQKRRIECSKRLLETTSLQLTDVYEFLGYSSLSHFIKLFRKYEGITPGEYRNLYGIAAGKN
ncbi:MAG: helix-turn-helix transcriptional regulator [Bullifex sp.]